MTFTALADIHALAEKILVGVEEGSSLETRDVALIRFGLASSITALDSAAITEAIAAALSEGVSPMQLQEVVSLVSGLGVHSLMATAVLLASAAGIDGDPLNPDQQALWDRYVGDDPFWRGFERELPGFLGATLRLSSDQFVAFFDYCAVPWKSGTVRARLKELDRKSVV